LTANSTAMRVWLVPELLQAAFAHPKMGRALKEVWARMRPVDRLVFEVVVISKGSAFLFNRYSSFSANVLETAVIHGRVALQPVPAGRSSLRRPLPSNVVVW
jgi:hypothetical protein